MSSRAQLIVTLPSEQADYIEALIAGGSYKSANDVIGAGLEALHDRNSTLEHWLREEVVATYDAMQNSPDRALTADEADERLKRHFAAYKPPAGHGV